MIKEGIVLYTIGQDGCLNGVYTNEHSKTAGVIYNEISRKQTQSIGIPGVYDCFYFDLGNSRENAILEITATGRILKFVWKDLAGKMLFTGTGYQMNEVQIAVHYMD